MSSQRVERSQFSLEHPPLFTAGGEPVVSHPIYLTDTTLRDGQQGWRPLRVEDAIRIYRVLARLAGPRGVVRVTELFPYTPRDREIVRAVLEEHSSYSYPRPIGWVRATRGDIDLVSQAGLEETVVLTSVSDYHLRWKLRWSREEALERFTQAVEYGLERGLRLRVAMEDITRADLRGFVLRLVERILRAAERHGVEREIVFKLSDTLGMGLPFPEAGLPRSVPLLVRLLREEAGLRPEQLEFHGHNDFHLVVANHLAAWLHGATFSNCTLFGVGERAGNCPLDAMLFHYAGLRGSFDGADPRALVEARRIFEELGYRVPEFYPLLGDNAFSTAAGIHIDGLLKNPLVYLPFDPQRVLGLEPSVRITRHSGRAGIVYALVNELGEEGRLMARDPRFVDDVYRFMVRKLESNGVQSMSPRRVAEIALELWRERRGSA